MGEEDKIYRRKGEKSMEWDLGENISLTNTYVLQQC